jgi:hypothetical protein
VIYQRIYSLFYEAVKLLNCAILNSKNIPESEREREKTMHHLVLLHLMVSAQLLLTQLRLLPSNPHQFLHNFFLSGGGGVEAEAAHLHYHGGNVVRGLGGAGALGDLGGDGVRV